MKKKVLLSGNIHPDGIRLLEEDDCEVIIANNDDEETLSILAQDVDGIIVRGMTRITERVIEAAKNCRVIGRHGVGLDTIDMQAASKHRILVVNTPGVNANAVAEHAVGLTLALAKQLCVLNARLKEHGDYEYRTKITSFELTGKTAGIIGLGRIGSRTAEIFQKGFNMKILGYDPFVSEEVLEGKGLMISLNNRLSRLLKNSDIVSIHMPATIENKSIIGKKELACMRKGAYLINTARGPLVDEAALYDALSSKRIAGAALDVFELEPPLPNNPLYDLDNVIVTPHTAGMTFESLRNMAVRVTTNVCSILNGKKPADLANPAIWEEERS